MEANYSSKETTLEQEHAMLSSMHEDSKSYLALIL